MYQNRNKLGLVATSVALALTAAVANADEVVLSSADGTVSIRGEFHGFDQDTYIVDYNGYKLRVPALDMTCEGANCLDFTPYAPVTVASAD